MHTIYRICFFISNFSFSVLFNLSYGIRIVDVFPFHRFNLLLQVLEDNEQSRNDEDLADHTDQHTTNRSCTQCTVTVGTYTECEHQRKQTDYHSQ